MHDGRESLRIPGLRRTPKVVLVDDDPVVLRAHARLFDQGNYDLIECLTAHQAIAHVVEEDVTVVVSDIAMPGMSGLELLRTIRQHDPDLPVILITGMPDIENATQAIEFGVFMYLTKPVNPDELLRTVDRASHLYQLAQAKREALELVGRGHIASDRAGLEASLDRALSTLWMAFQPIVRLSDRSIFGYEALLRSKEASLPGPPQVLDAAERLNQLPRLGKIIRERAAAPARDLADRLLLFVNLHPRDVLDPALCDPQAPLSLMASRVVLEVTERAALTDVNQVRARVAELRALGFRIAVDDLGAGYAGLNSFAQLEPEFVKLDMSLVRGIDKNHTKQKVVASMTRLCKDIGLSVIAEGVETVAEQQELQHRGCDLVQGFLYARPGRPFPIPRWPSRSLVP